MTAPRRSRGLTHAWSGTEERVGREWNDAAVAHRRHVREIGEERASSCFRSHRGVDDHVRRTRDHQLERHLRKRRADVGGDIHAAGRPHQLVLQRSPARDDERSMAHHQEHAARRQAGNARVDAIELTANPLLHLDAALRNAQRSGDAVDRAPEIVQRPVGGHQHGDAGALDRAHRLPVAR